MKFLWRYTYILLICSFSLILLSKDGYSEIRVAYYDRFAVGQEIYNWIDVDNESINRMVYRVDGIERGSGGPTSSIRWQFTHQYANAGSHNFEVDIYKSNGEHAHYAWTATIYNPTKNLAGAISYADYYAIWPNLGEYWYFASDCTNFVSQILHDGGGFPEDRNGGWYYGGRFDYGNAWTVVSDFYTYMIGKGIIDVGTPDGSSIVIGGEPTYIYPPLRNGKAIKFTFPGGVLHNTFVVGHDAGTGVPVSDSHSINRKRVDWTLIPYNDDWETTKVTQYGINWGY